VYAASGNREMRAERRVTVCEDGERIRVVRNEDGDEEEDEKQDERKEKSESSENKENDDEEDEDDEDEPEGEDEERKRNGDKLPNLFGILLPPALRAARVDSIKMVEEIVPRLAEVEGEMRAVEIEVRRARKRMAKVGAAGEKGTGKK
jgi:ABC-type Zn2+ transport system substrate-binding protein/surface adhesin